MCHWTYLPKKQFIFQHGTFEISCLISNQRSLPLVEIFKSSESGRLVRAKRAE